VPRIFTRKIYYAQTFVTTRHGQNACDHCDVIKHLTRLTTPYWKTETETVSYPHYCVHRCSPRAHDILRTHVFVRQLPSQAGPRPLPCTQPSCDTSTSNVVNSVDYTMRSHKEIFRPMQHWSWNDSYRQHTSSFNLCQYQRYGTQQGVDYFIYPVNKDCYCPSTIINKLQLK